MVARRGAPGSEAHAALRRAQQRQGNLPTYAQLAGVVAVRLAARPADCGDVGIAATVGPVTPEEARTHGVPTGWTIPEPVRRVARLALAGTIEELVAAGLVPSAEVFARLVPGLAAVATAAAYEDPALRTLMAQHYRAFRARRSLLLLHLEHQVRIDELPWVVAVAPYCRAGGAVRSGAAATLTQVARLALQSFPAAVMPNPLVRELAALARQAGLDLPWVEELAADIFMGTFSAKFLAAAKVAAQLLRGSLYQRYYGIDADAILSLPDASRERWGVKTSAEFDELCRQRAGVPERGWSVAANGMVIEQAQIPTTRNLAVVAVRWGWCPTAAGGPRPGQPARRAPPRRAGRRQPAAAVDDQERRVRLAADALLPVHGGRGGAARVRLLGGAGDGGPTPARGEVPGAGPRGARPRGRGWLVRGRRLGRRGCQPGGRRLRGPGCHGRRRGHGRSRDQRGRRRRGHGQADAPAVPGLGRRQALDARRWVNRRSMNAGVRFG
jgi:hypothetical protein